MNRRQRIFLFIACPLCLVAGYCLAWAATLLAECHPLAALGEWVERLAQMVGGGR